MPAAPSPSPQGGTAAVAVVRLFICAVRAVAPLSVLLVVLCLVSWVASIRVALLDAVPTVAKLAAAAEAAFFWWFQWRFAQLNRRTQPPPISTAARRQLVEKTVAASCDHREFVSGWFRSAPFEAIGTGNAHEWAAWSLTGRPVHELTSEEHKEATAAVEAFGLAPFMREGYNHELKGRAIRINLDTMGAMHRPIASYVVTSFFAVAALHFSLRRLGFSRRRAGALLYWHRPSARSAAAASAGPTRRPIVLLHGIGLGLLPYIYMLKQLIASEHGQGSAIFCPEFPHISQHLLPAGGRPPASPQATAESIRTMLSRHGVGAIGSGAGSGATFVAHSFGSVVFSWLLKQADAAAMQELIANVLLLEPVSMGLQEPDVAYNFLYRPPTGAVQHFFKYFVCSELGISNVLHRHFWWYENVLWHDDVPQRLRRADAFKVLLAADDSIVNVDKVVRLFNDTGLFTPAGDSGGVEEPWADVTVLPGLQHAQMCADTNAVATVVRLIGRLT